MIAKSCGLALEYLICESEQLDMLSRLAVMSVIQVSITTPYSHSAGVQGKKNRRRFLRRQI
jgi:hypothetical protein